MFEKFLIVLVSMKIVGKCRTMSKMGYKQYYAFIPFLDCFLLLKHSERKLTLYWILIIIPIVNVILNFITTPYASKIIGMIFLVCIVYIRANIMLKNSNNFIGMNKDMLGLLSFLDLQYLYSGYSKSKFVSPYVPDEQFYKELKMAKIIGVCTLISVISILVYVMIEIAKFEAMHPFYRMFR